MPCVHHEYYVYSKITDILPTHLTTAHMHTSPQLTHLTTALTHLTTALTHISHAHLTMPCVHREYYVYSKRTDILPTHLTCTPHHSSYAHLRSTPHLHTLHAHFRTTPHHTPLLTTQTPRLGAADLHIICFWSRWPPSESSLLLTERVELSLLLQW